MLITWDEEAWADYVEWQNQDKKTLKKINQLVKDIMRNGVLEGTRNPEALKGNLQGWYSRRIDKKNRLVYKIVNDNLKIAQCKEHY
ncbi:toxin YoeB [Selenomonas ruminantium]|uniref:Endoribonuclease YoeB n=1 Tax=Selenomonas ruminantium TaxID=971 RepID=A0A1M6XI69_SELRU|nr:Txe/YoeB family addiction module toxin [Selenomonas ruminantium]SHL05720.1 toxin YoeB [Selenomonas ruminantium]